MADDAGPPYQIERTPRAEEQLRACAEAARGERRFADYVAAWKAIIAILETGPADWGEPLYRLKHQGGMVRNGVVPPVVVHFAVYEAERVVCLIGVRLLPPAAGT